MRTHPLRRSARMMARLSDTAAQLRQHPDDRAAARRYDRQLAAYDRIAAEEHAENAATDGMITLTWVLAAVTIGMILVAAGCADLTRT